MAGSVNDNHGRRGESMTQVMVANKAKLIKAVEEFSIGGRPRVGEVISVGEKGRELFVADRSGTIVPNTETEMIHNIFSTLDPVKGNSGMVLVKSSSLDKSSGLDQRINKSGKVSFMNLGGEGGSTPSNPTFNTGDQLSSVPSEDSSNIDLVSGSLVYGLVG